MNTKRIEAALLVASEPLTLEALAPVVFDELPEDGATSDQLRSLEEALETLQAELEQSDSVQGLVKVASGWRYQLKPSYTEPVGRLWESKPAKYSRAFLETLAIIAYRQPVTRGDIEEIRGVSVSTNIMRTLEERQWVRVIGHKDVPGRPAMYATDRQFLDDLGLQSLDELPDLIDEVEGVSSANVLTEVTDAVPASLSEHEPIFSGEMALPLEDDESARTALFAQLEDKLEGLPDDFIDPMEAETASESEELEP